MKSIRSIVFVSLILIAYNQAFAENAVDLKITASPWSPYVSRSLQGSGVAISIVTSALNRAGYTFSFALESWPSDLEKTRLGVYDMIASIWFTEDRAEDLTFSEPVIQNRIMFIVSEDSDIKLENMEDLKGHRVGVVEDYAYTQKVYDSLPVQMINTASVEDNLQRLLSGDIDIAIADEHVAIYTLNSKMPDSIRKVRIVESPLPARQLRVAVSNKRSDAAQIIADINNALRSMKEDGTYQAILHQFKLNP